MPVVLDWEAMENDDEPVDKTRATKFYRARVFEGWLVAIQKETGSSEGITAIFVPDKQGRWDEDFDVNALVPDEV